MKIRPYFKWFDFWVGLFYDIKKKALYIGIPMFGIKITLHKNEDKKLKPYGEAEEEADFAAIHEAEKRLLLCPFCGASAIINYVPPHTHGELAEFMPDCKGEHFIECTGCTCAISGGSDLEEAITAWNRRAD